MVRLCTILALILFAVLGAGSEAACTGLNITNIQVGALSSGSTNVTFDMSWSNSWRFTSPGAPAPNNWDAAWVFIKFRKNGGDWLHGRLNASGHSVGSGTAATYTVGYANTGAPFDISSNPGVGAFMFRSSDGAGATTLSAASLSWNYAEDGVAPGDAVDVRVFGIEMVYVPEGEFFAGDNATSTAALKQGSGDIDPWRIVSEGAITTANGAGTGSGLAENAAEYYYVSGSNADEDSTGSVFTIPAAFPKGYQAFYVMKAEITQSQWSVFFNSLPTAQRSARDITATKGDTLIARNNISWTNGDISQPDQGGGARYGGVAMNYLSWGDFTAYLDWCGLRPMSELEFERAARGPYRAVPGEYSWGSASLTQANTISDSGLATERAQSGANAAYGNHSSVPGPLRVGSFAYGVATRIEAGAGYYGAMDLSGNLSERLVSIGNSAGRNFNGTYHGDGALDSTGNSNVTTWPALTGAGAGVRGGSWSDDASSLRLSDRRYATHSQSARSDTCGGRGARSGYGQGMPTNTPTPTPTATQTPDQTSTPTTTPTATASATTTTTSTASPSATPTNTPTATTTATPTETQTLTPTSTPSPLPSTTPTETPTQSPTSTATPTPSLTATATATATPTPYVPQVSAVWPTNGANWMDYVVNTSYSSQKVTQVTDAACTGGGASETDIRSCLHGGEFRKVALAVEGSCSNLVIKDYLDLFGWVCDDSSGSVVFYSVGLKPGKGLADLLESDGSAWKDNYVTITGGATTYTSAAAKWWTNTLTALSDNSSTNASPVSLSTSGTIYYVPSSAGSKNTNGYHINAHKVAVITLGGSSLRYGDNSNNANTCTSTGTVVASGGASKSIICGGSKNFSWIEGTFYAARTVGTYDAVKPIFLYAAHNARINEINLYPTSSQGLVISGSSKNVRMSGLRVSSGAGYEVYADNYTGTYFARDVTVVNSTSNTNIGLGSSSIYHRIKILNGGGTLWNGGTGMKNTRLVQVLLASGAYAAPSGGQYNNYIGMDILNSSNSATTGAVGIGSGGTTVYSNVHNILSANNTLAGVALGAANAGSYNTFSQLALMSNSYGVYMDKDLSTGNKFTGNLILGNNGSSSADDCAYEAGTITSTPGLADDCSNQGGSDANLVQGKSISDALVGEVAASDASNGSENSSGQASYASTLDWFNFATPSRAWGKVGTSAFPHSSSRARCASGTCAIWDYGLKTKTAANSVIYNNTNSGSTTANTTPTANSTCPSEIAGSNYLTSVSYTYAAQITTGGLATGFNGYNTTDSNFTDLCTSGETCVQRYLKNAIELIGAIDKDPSSSTFGQQLGDMDGMCEAGEACLYTPNFGYYQGHSSNNSPYNDDGTRAGNSNGNLETCTYSANGGIPNVKMYFYKNNGY